MPRTRYLDYRPNYNHFRNQRSIRRRSLGVATGIYSIGTQLYNTFYTDRDSRPSRQEYYSNQEHSRYLQHRQNRSSYNVQSSSSSSDPESSIVSEMARGSYGTYHSTSAGRFGPTRRARYDATASYAKKGFSRELTVGGRVVDSNCVYLGHTPHAVDTTFYQVIVSLLRSLFNIMDIDIEWQDSYIPRLIDGEDQIRIDWIDNSNTVQNQAFQLLAGPTYRTLNQVALDIYVYLKTNIRDQGRRSYRRIYVVNTGGDGTVRLSCNLLKAQVDIFNSSYLKIQNSTESSHGETPDDSDELQTSVNALPLKGMAYFGKGTYTGLDAYSYLLTRGDAAATVPTEITAHPDNGFLTLRGQNTDAGIVSPQVYFNPPPAKQMIKVSGASHVTLEPGCLKSDALTFRFKGYFNQYLYSLYCNGYISTTPLAGGLFSRSNLGAFKLFALEKKINATTDKIKVNYELNQVVRCRVFLPKMANSMVISNDKGVTSAIVNYDH